MTTQFPGFELPSTPVSIPEFEAPDSNDEETEPLPDESSDEEDEEGAGESLSYEDWFNKIESSPDLKAEHDTRTQAREKEISVEQYRKFQSSIQPAIDRWSQNSAATKQALGQLAGMLQKSVVDGTLEPQDLANVLQANQPALEALNQQMWWEGSYFLLNSLGKVTENESFANEMLGRLYAMAGGKPDPNFGNDLLSSLVEPIVAAKVKEAEAAAYARGQREAAKAKVEETRAEKRKGGGPDLQTKRPGGSLPKSVEHASLEDLFSMESKRLQDRNRKR